MFIAAICELPSDYTAE